MEKVNLSPYKAEWEQHYEREECSLRSVFLELCSFKYVEHIGGTAVEDLFSRPVIEILAQVGDINEVDESFEDFVDMGYKLIGNVGKNGRHFVKYQDGRLKFELFVLSPTEEYLADGYLAVRKYLQTFPYTRDKYSELKRSLAKRFPNDLESYLKGKNDFLKELLGVALKTEY